MAAIQAAAAQAAEQQAVITRLAQRMKDLEKMASGEGDLPSEAPGGSSFSPSAASVEASPSAVAPPLPPFGSIPPPAAPAAPTALAAPAPAAPAAPAVRPSSSEGAGQRGGSPRLSSLLGSVSGLDNIGLRLEAGLAGATPASQWEVVDDDDDEEQEQEPAPAAAPAREEPQAAGSGVGRTISPMDMVTGILDGSKVLNDLNTSVTPAERSLLGQIVQDEIYTMT